MNAMTAIDDTDVPRITIDQLRGIVIRDAHRDVTQATRHGWLTTTIHVTDLRMLLDRIYQLCPDHGRCPFCEDHLCAACGLGQVALLCPGVDAHCDRCVGRCVDCQAAIENAS